jgi:hypothetical protein
MSKQALNDLMEFDHVVRVHPDGTVTDAEDGWWAPEVYIDVDEDGQALDNSDEELARMVSPWRLMDGYSGQYRYSGPVMHASEFIGGRMEDDIRERPGVYVACVVECLGPNPGADENEEPAGWVVCYQLDEDTEDKA